MRTGDERDRIQHVLRRWLREDAPPAGEPLPPERTICAQVGGSLSTVHRALVEMENEGLVIRKGRRFAVSTTRSPRRSPQSPIGAAVVVASPPYPEDHHSLHTRSGWPYRNHAGTVDRLNEMGVKTFIVDIGEFDTRPDRFLSHEPSGVIFTEASGIPPAQRTIERVRSWTVPMAGYGDYPEFASIDRVSFDHAKGAEELTSFLIAKGCRRIQLVNCRDRRESYWTGAKREGHERAMKAAGLPMETPMEECPIEPWAGLSTEEAFHTRVHYCAGLLAPLVRANRLPDAMMLMSDAMVPRFAAACRLLGLEPNQDILLAGYDCFWDEWHEFKFEPTPPIATIDKGFPESGAAMADLLIERMGGYEGAPRLVLCPPRLIDNSSIARKPH